MFCLQGDLKEIEDNSTEFEISILSKPIQIRSKPEYPGERLKTGHFAKPGNIYKCTEAKQFQYRITKKKDLVLFVKRPGGDKEPRVELMITK